MISRRGLQHQLFLIVLPLLLLLPAVACGGSASAPPPAASSPLSTPTALLPLATQPVVAFIAPATQNPPAAAIPESRRLTLEFPSRMRAGVESDVVRLTLEVDNLGNVTPTAQIAGNEVVGQTIQVPNLYETHDVTAEAQLDLAGMTVQPSGPTFEPLIAGQSTTFYWSIRPQDVGNYQGTVWLHLNFRERATAKESRIAVSAQLINIKAVDFFGLSVNLVRTSGLIGSLVGGVVGFPFIEDILKFLFKRLRRN